MNQINLYDIVEEKETVKYKPKESKEWKWTFSDYPKQKNNIKVFSCFACGGGSTMGYKLSGCDVIGDLEIDKKVNDIYIKNHNPKLNYNMDIRDFNKLEDLPEELYNLDILDGSPPCTTFSMAGKREDSWGEKKKFREGQAEQTLDDLCFHFIDTAKKLQPKVVIMENVEGLLLGAAWTYVQNIYKDFIEAGYNAKHYLLKGEYMGVPQKRHRVFFIAVRKDIDFNFNSLDLHFNYKPITYGEIKEGSCYPINEASKTYHMALKANDKDTSLADTSTRIEGKRCGFNTRYIRKNSVMSTIRAKLDVIDLEELAFISKETAIRSQTFPLDYNFMDNSRGTVAYICGMSVPPIMIKRIVNRLIKTGVFKNE